MGKEGKIVIQALPPTLLEGLETLPDHLDKYFDSPPGTVSIPVGQLIVTHVQETGIQNANRLMRQAYDGRIERRSPILVRQVGDHYIIQDGNSTVINALFSGWPTVYCLAQHVKVAGC